MSLSAASDPRTAFTWRISQIPTETTSETLLSYFEERDREWITIGSLCPDAYGDDVQTATVLFKPPRDRPSIRPDFTYHSPREQLEIEKDFHGFTPLYCPAPGTAIAADVIAITGLAGHAFGSWAHSDERMWLRDYLPKWAKNARILTYGYASHLTGDSMSFASLGDLANRFVDELITIRDEPECEQRPIIFIGHSLGCLMIKKSMTRARDLDVDSSRLPVRAIIFLAAPHRGMNIEFLRAIVKNEPPEQLISELAAGSSTLNELNERFKQVAHEIKILTCYETQKTKTLKRDESTGRYTRSGEAVLMLDSGSAIQYWDKEIAIPAHANHSSIAKLKKGGGSIFQAVRSTIKQALAPTSQVSRQAGGPQQNQSDDGDLPFHEPSSRSSLGVRDHLEPQSWSDQRAYMSQMHTTPRRPLHDPTSAHGGREGSPASGDALRWDAARNTERQFSSQAPSSWSNPDRAFRGHSRPPFMPDPLHSPPAPGQPSPPQTVRESTEPFPPPVTGYPAESSRPMNGHTMTEYGSNLPATQHQAPHAPGRAHYASVQQFPHMNPYEADLPHQKNKQQITEPKMMQDFGRMNIRAPTQGFENAPSAPLQSAPSTSQSLGSTAANEENDESLNHLHPGIYCDHCDGEIVGVRWQCAQCPKWNLCSDCFPGRLGTHPPHQFKAIQPPVNQHEGDEETSDDDDADDDVHQPGVDNCSSCNRVVTSPPEFFFHCTICTQQQITCLTCQQDLTHCLRHDQPVQRKRFIFYGSQLRSIPWVELGVKVEDSMLVQVLKRRDITALDRYVRDSHLVNAIDSDGRTPLHIAVSLHFDMGVKFLLMYGASPEIRDRYLYTPLGLAILYKANNMAISLLDSGANPNSIENGGDTPLHLACFAGSEHMVRSLLDGGDVQVDKRNTNGQTPLYLCCVAGNWDLAEVLLDAGADANTTDDEGATQIGELAAYDEAEAVEFLLGRGAQLEAQDSLGRTILCRAVAAGNLKLCRMLLKRGANARGKTKDHEDTILGVAAATGETDIVDVLLQWGAITEDKDSRWRTPLFIAASAGELDVCRCLLEHGADPNPGPALLEDWPGSEGGQFDLESTILHAASVNGHAGVAHLLASAGAELEAQDQCGRTPLFLAAEYGQLDSCRALVVAGANGDASALNHSIVSIAAKWGNLEVIQYLLQNWVSSAIPPPGVKGGKWKNFEFAEGITYGQRTIIMNLLRAHKHDRD